MENLQMVIGSSLSLFHCPIDQILKFCHGNWLLNVWEFLHSVQGTIHLEHGWSFGSPAQTWCFHHGYSLGSWCLNFPLTKTLKCINACRIFLQVFTLADISDGSGRDILKCSLYGLWHSNRRSSSEWPKQIQPSSAAWRSLEKDTTDPILCDTSINKTLAVSCYMDTGCSLTQNWTYYFYSGTKSLVHCVEASGIFHCYHQARQSPWIFHSTSEIIFSRPSCMIPVTVAQRIAQFLELTACPLFSHTTVQSSKSSATAVKTSISISHYLQQLPQVLLQCNRPLSFSIWYIWSGWWIQ